jgi:hypothetical protein
MPEAHNIWVQFTQREESDLNNAIQGRIPSGPVFYFSWTPPNQILHFQELLPAGTAISAFSKRSKKTDQWVLRPQVQEYTAVIPTYFENRHGWTDRVGKFIQDFIQTNKIHVVPIGAVVGPVHWV